MNLAETPRSWKVKFARDAARIALVLPFSGLGFSEGGFPKTRDRGTSNLRSVGVWRAIQPSGIPRVDPG